MGISLFCGIQDMFLSGSPLNKWFLIKLGLLAFAFDLMDPLAFGSCCIYLLFMEQDPSPVEHSMISMECELSIEWRVEYHWEWWEGTKLASYGTWNILRLSEYGWRERRSQHLKSEMWCISKLCCLGKELKGTWDAGAGAEAGRPLQRLSPMFPRTEKAGLDQKMEWRWKIS